MKKLLVLLVALSWCPINSDVTIADLTAQVDKIIGQLNDLADDFVDGKLLPLDTTSLPADTAAADAAEKQMNLLVLPFYNSFSGIRTTNKKLPSELTASDVARYATLFAAYQKVYNTSDELYNYYNFGKFFLDLLGAVNVLQKDFETLNIKGVSDISAAKLSQKVLDDAIAYQNAFAAYTACVKAMPKGFKKPFSVLLSDVYQVDSDCAAKVISLKDQIPSGTPPAAGAVADDFILKNFGDANLSKLAAADLQGLLDAFGKTYTASDDFYAEYQMWDAYVSSRYWQLQLLTRIQQSVDTPTIDIKGAANAFAGTYLNGFKVAHKNNASKLKEPYATQLNDLEKEFMVTYWLARLEIYNS